MDECYKEQQEFEGSNIEQYRSERELIDSQIERLREKYKPGLRIALVHMKDPDAPPVGTKGTVRCVNEAGDILVAWDNGSFLSIIPEDDEIEIISEK